MKVTLDPKIVVHRGGDVKVGNVYSNPKFRYWRIVVGIINYKGIGRQRWNNVVCIHVDIDGDIVGASCQPTKYMSEHQDLVGHVKQMPSMKIEWLRER